MSEFRETRYLLLYSHVMFNWKINNITLFYSDESVQSNKVRIYIVYTVLDFFMGK